MGFQKMALKLLLGLGNPEPCYDMTRHNAGFAMIDRLAIKCGAALSMKKQIHAEIGKTRFAGSELMLAKPTTYMNLSGRAAQAIMNFFKIERSNLIVVHDEVALPLGTIRLARGGGGAGNHGIENIIECLGHKDFQRLRIGVGPDPGGALRAQFVLSKIAQVDQALYFKSIDMAIDATEIWLQEGLQSAMNKFNGMDLREQK